MRREGAGLTTVPGMGTEGVGDTKMEGPSMSLLSPGDPQHPQQHGRRDPVFSLSGTRAAL